MQSLLDNDLYKFSMSYAYMVKFPNAEGVFEFFDRNKTKITSEQFNQIKQNLFKLSEAVLSPEEKAFMQKAAYYIPAWYWDWLERFKFNPNDLEITHVDECLHIKATGRLYEVTLWEVPILATIATTFTKFQAEADKVETNESILERTREKAIKLKAAGVNFSDFGTRRRAGAPLHDKVVEILKDLGGMCGTSNCYLAYRHNLTPIGTVAHEWFMASQAFYGLTHANLMGLENWSDVFGGDLGIALTDTYTSELFFKNFSTKMSKLFDGVRHDSGDPFDFMRRTYEHYRSKRIDPLTKTIVFSDALTTDKAISLSKWGEGKIKTAFGIGTHFTNDIEGITPANIVMKLTKCRMTPKQNWAHCVKISDDISKAIGDEETKEIILKQLKNT